MRSILFVDDEPAVIDGMRDAVRRYRGASAMAFAESGTAALTLLASHAFDVVVSDMRMPGMDGIALLAAVRAQYPATLRIVLSGYSEPDAMVRALSVAHLFLTKPCGAAELMATIDRACRSRELLSEGMLLTAVRGASTLPSVPSVHAHLNEVIDDPAASARELGTIVEQDMAMAAKVLQVANSAMLRLERRATSVPEAASYLGLHTLKLIATSRCTFPFDPRAAPAGFSIEGLQRHSLVVARIAARIAEEDGLPADAFTAGLLHDVGKLVFASRTPRASAQHRAAHAEAGGCLLGLWGLPDALVEAVAHHHDPARASTTELSAATVIHVADALAHELVPVPGERTPAMHEGHLTRVGVAARLPAWRALAALAAGT
jgi:putative nucleotidyltransferase with HDIG domain